ncbi:DUF6304 family protein [Bizionia arctica]|uniref:Uncharacterized protein n=1 Tax=Bizionia arctica TaxID=1495645 RepID=A0A917GNT3_9FLAO|nr:DUF6304 family protein [Bizionia arctica]GGG52442.1 hypothetical protein GCM10010976_24460 [Bizionia arctica]
MKIYSAKYKDKFGELETKIYSDGSSLNLTLRGIQFEGTDFEGLEGIVDESKFEYVLYENGIGDLTNFELMAVIPVNIVRNKKEIIGNLETFIATGNNNSVVRLKLETEYDTFLSEKEYGYFEDAIIGIQEKLPENTKIKTCLSCKYSNYHPIGNGMFGGLNCFKNLKEDVENVSGKSDLMVMWDKGMENKKTFNVQETFVCDDHKFVTKNDWVYKDWT